LERIGFGGDIRDQQLDCTRTPGSIVDQVLLDSTETPVETAIDR